MNKLNIEIVTSTHTLLYIIDIHYYCYYSSLFHSVSILCMYIYISVMGVKYILVCIFTDMVYLIVVFSIFDQIHFKCI